MVGKKVLSLLSAFLLVGTLGACASKNPESKVDKTQKVYSIGVSQIIEHPALDGAKQGFIDELKAQGYENGKNVKFDFQNAQGDAPNCDSIAKKFVSEKKDMILAISTPSAQTAYNATKNIPILITAVTDPVKEGMAKSLEKSGNNVTGTSDAVSVEQQFELLKEIIPSVKRIGIIYNTSEANSQGQVDNAKKVGEKLGIKVVTQGITSINEVPQVIASILDNIDVLYVPTDNMVASSLSIITEKCFEKNIPVIGSEKAHTEKGAFMSKGVNYYDLGRETGKKAVQIIKGKKPSEIPITIQQKFEISINKDAIKKLKITIPEKIVKDARMVTGGVK